MIKRVWGSCNSVDIIFTRTDTGRWKTIYPVNKSGMYILELYAEDIAGNTGYLATVIFTIDLKNMCITIKFLEDGKARFRHYCTSGRLSDVVKPELKFNRTVIGFRNFCADVVRCNICGSW